MKLKLLPLLSTVALAGCSLFQPEVITKTELSFIKILCPEYPPVEGITMLTVKPRAVIDSDGLPWVGLTAGDYQNLGINLKEFIRYTKDQKGHLKYYQDCIRSFNTEIERLEGLEKS
jgi:hypothetical protein